MASALKNLSSYKEDELASAEEMTFGIIVADWNEAITHKLYEGCYDTFIKHGAKAENIHTVQVPGTFELPTGARMLSANKDIDGFVCLGCVIKGETSHNEYINQSVASGLMNLGIMSGKPYIFGVLTPNNEQQAIDRAGGKYGNKGIEAAVTAIRMVALKNSLKEQKASIGFSN
jgi:6,7-dimethyl-8-ribityllumazine synthase